MLTPRSPRNLVEAAVRARLVPAPCPGNAAYRPCCWSVSVQCWWGLSSRSLAAGGKQRPAGQSSRRRGAESIGGPSCPPHLGGCTGHRSHPGSGSVPSPGRLQPSREPRHGAEHLPGSVPAEPEPFLLPGASSPRRLLTINAVVREPRTDSSQAGTAAPAVPGGPVKLSHSISCNTSLRRALQPAPRGCPGPAESPGMAPAPSRRLLPFVPRALPCELRGSAYSTANGISPRATEANPFCCTQPVAAVAVPWRSGGMARHGTSWHGTAWHGTAWQLPKHSAHPQHPC